MVNYSLGIGSRIVHQKFGKGVVVQVLPIHYEIVFIESGLRQISRDCPDFEIIEEIETPSDWLTFEKIEKSLIRILRRYEGLQENVELGNRWTGGKLVLQPGDPDLKNKEVPIETFFHKIVLIRDRLRIMEQRINSSKNLSDEEKIDLQQYITKIYGSLTTFNVLFKYKDDYFVGDKGE